MKLTHNMLVHECIVFFLNSSLVQDIKKKQVSQRAAATL